MQCNINIANYFSKKEINALARTKGFVKRKSDITGFNFLLTFTTGLMNTSNSTLTQLAVFLNNTCNLNISPQGIDERINKEAKEFLKVCLSKAMKITMQKLTLANNLINCFSHIYIIDSTNFDLHPSLKEIFKGSGGSASKSSMRIQLIFDYFSKKIYIEIGDNRTSDATTLFEMIKNNSLDTSGICLFLQDLGYFKTESFLLMNNADHHFISKLKYNTKIYNENGRQIDLFDIIKKQPKIIDQQILLGNFKCRLIGCRLPNNVVNQRRRKANKEAMKKRGTTITKEYSIFLSYGFFITTLSKQYTPQAIFTIYRLRWQIELIFKTWKSILGIHKINSTRIERIMCEVYGKLILAVLMTIICNHLIIENSVTLSSFKVFQYFKSIIFKWAEMIVAGKDKHIKFLSNSSIQILRFCRKNKQKNKPTIELLLDAICVANKSFLAHA